MKIIEEKSEDIIEIITNVYGEILYVNNDAKKAFKTIKAGKDIGSLIDIDYLQKLSMFSEKTDVVPINHERYKEAKLTVFSKGYNKFIKITFFKGSKDKTNDDWITDKRILAIFGEVGKITDKKDISLSDFCDAIKATVKKQYYYLNTYYENGEFYYSESLLQSLILNSVAMMHEIDPNKAVDLYLSRHEDCLKIKILSSIAISDTAKNWQQIEKIFPCTALRISCMDEACEKNKIKNSAHINDKTLKIEFTIKELKKDGTELHIKPIFAYSWDTISDILKPREGIATKYGTQAVEQEG